MPAPAVRTSGFPFPGFLRCAHSPHWLLALARERVAPEYLLLTDADIAHEPDSLRELVAAARSAELDLVSQMARLRASNDPDDRALLERLSSILPDGVFP